MDKKSYFSKKFGSVAPSRKLWSSLRQLGFLKDSECAIPPFTADELNEHFVSRATYSDFPRVINVSHAPLLHSSQRTAPFSFSNVFGPEAKAAVNNVKSNSVGLDYVPISFIKLLLLIVLPSILLIFNSVITKSFFPKSWKTAKVLPRHKCSRTYSLDDYRSISILPSLSKVLEKALKWQISDHLKEHDLLFKFQSGFRPNHSTTSTLLQITNDIRNNMSRNVATVLLLLDFSKTFDSVSHSLLAGKLVSQFGFSSYAEKLVSSYLSGRSQLVSFNGFQSQLCEVNCGLPQGSVLGPVFVSMFINDLPDSLNHCKSHLFADDFQLYKSVHEDNVLADVHLLKMDLSAISA